MRPRRASVVFVSSWLYSGYKVTVEEMGDGQCAVEHEYWVVLPAGVPGAWIDHHQKALTDGTSMLAARLPAALEAGIAEANG